MSVRRYVISDGSTQRMINWKIRFSYFVNSVWTCEESEEILAA